MPLSILRSMTNAPGSLIRIHTADGQPQPAKQHRHQRDGGDGCGGRREDDRHDGRSGSHGGSLLGVPSAEAASCRLLVRLPTR
jgi:hypothetical protein